MPSQPQSPPRIQGKFLAWGESEEEVERLEAETTIEREIMLATGGGGGGRSEGRSAGGDKVVAGFIVRVEVHYSEEEEEDEDEAVAAAVVENDTSSGDGKGKGSSSSGGSRGGSGGGSGGDSGDGSGDDGTPPILHFFTIVSLHVPPVAPADANGCEEGEGGGSGGGGGGGGSGDGGGRSGGYGAYERRVTFAVRSERELASWVMGLASLVSAFEASR